MRERTTWDRNEIAKQASGHAKKADPYTMNQPEHMKAQPSADAYVTGTPSDFAEDVHPSSDTWEAEYSGGKVRRNEIGMPEYRSDTFNHAEKTASEEVLVKKAALCVRVARCVLSKSASEASVEDQALSFMHLPDSDLISTYNRLAAEEEDQAQEQESEQQAQASQKQDQKQAGQMPPQFKENAEKKKEEAEAKKDEGQEKKAQGQSQIAQAMQAMQQGDMKQAEQAMQAAVQQMAQQLMQQLAQGQQQVAQAQQQMAQQQQVAQQQQQQMAQQQMAPTSDDQLLDQMLAEGQPQEQASLADDIELEAQSMDVGTEQLDPVADEQLMQLFANQDEAQQAEQAQQVKQASYGVRTASTRTVGARPTNGVSRLGGVVASAPASNSGGRDLSAIWNSAPDVSDVFGLSKG